ncbi:MAG: glycosyltransferase family 2 protein, partial [Candidatus Levybacteria bacterium]|nr:glycosyltransferase family 2 protein [Candidatus Levybacteria bacterium]
MKKNNNPFCSLIVLNYNGEKVIKDTLNSLLTQSYPKNKYEIIVVDNNSQDNSREILTKHSKDYKNIKAFFLENNLGFSKGNNFGIKKSKGEYVALINNDCLPETNWLKEIVASAIKDKKIFAVNSKILLYPRYINLKFSVDLKIVPVYVWLSKSLLCNGSDSGVVYLPLWKKTLGGFDTGNYFTIELPYDPYEDKIVEFVILFNSRGLKFDKETNLHDLVTFDNNSISIASITVNGDDIEYQVMLRLTNLEVINNSLNKVQNAGIMVFQDGYGRDIGAVVRSGQQFHEYDVKQYNKIKEVYAACAAAVLYKKNVLKKIGLLDESFFMYYEDVEISERARFAGFKIIYNPKAVARHHHALSSKEWSPLFIYHVEKGRLLHVFYNFPLKVFLREYLSLVIKSFLSLSSILFRFGTFLYNVKNK